MQMMELQRPWPEPPNEIVYHGLAGEIVRALDPHTEADPIAVLVQLLTAFGAAVGDGPYFHAGVTRHQPRLFIVIVGKSSRSRKGDSWQCVSSVLLPSGVAPRIQTSLSSGEGLIWMVRDPIIKTKYMAGQAGQQGHYEQIVEDEGEPEKRVLVVAGEYSQILKVMRREGNTLSAIIRDAWDQGNLSIATRSMAAQATGVYFSMIGHITADELREELGGLEAANGFANRFIWFAVKRSKSLPTPKELDDEWLAAWAARFREAVEQARQIGQVRRAEEARLLWREIYSKLARERDGLLGALLGRSEAQVLRLSMLYALLDGSPLIRVEHLRAAYELWGYAERSVEYLFGDMIGQSMADTILLALKQNFELTRSQIHKLFSRNATRGEIDEALGLLYQENKVRYYTEQTKGRPREIWHPFYPDL